MTATVVWLTNAAAVATYLALAAGLLAGVIASSRSVVGGRAGEPRPLPLARHAAGASPTSTTPAPEATGTGAHQHH